jgi:hypothetical protein
MTQHDYITLLENTLQELVEAFEPTTPPTILGTYTPEVDTTFYAGDSAPVYVEVSEEVEEAISRAEEVLALDEENDWEGD